MVAFIGGGILPQERRGTKLDGLMAVWDTWSTFCELAGVDPTDTRAAAAGLPPIDSVSMLDYIMG